jgi:hypothetical protein
MSTRIQAVIGTGVVVFGLIGGAAAAAAQTASAVTTPAVSEAEVLTLRERVAAYWAARVASDDKTQWELLEPRGRGRLTPQEYAAGRKGVRYLGYQIEDATINGYFAKVKVRLLFQPVIPRMVNVGPQTILLDDEWIRVNGTWYHQLDERQPERQDR